MLVIGATLYIPMAWQDFKDREISVYFLFLPYANFIITALLFPSLALLFAPFLFIVALTLYALGMLAVGDVVASPLLFAEPFAEIYVVAALVAVALAHSFYGIITNKEKSWWQTMPMVGYIGVANAVGVLVFIIAIVFRI